ncbi:MAG: hypothetical protein DRQ08_04780 [Candidatus Latescibacterota bacterium]|nr:MAG: hypothetical protein DRQ08_04780 [Candidatus Latescibacterota bacterium]
MLQVDLAHARSMKTVPCMEGLPIDHSRAMFPKLGRSSIALGGAWKGNCHIRVLTANAVGLLPTHLWSLKQQLVLDSPASFAPGNEGVPMISTKNSASSEKMRALRLGIEMAAGQRGGGLKAEG